VETELLDKEFESEDVEEEEEEDDMDEEDDDEEEERNWMAWLT